MRYFSMFSGIGGFEEGIGRATGDGWGCIGYSEIDKHAIRCYQHHFPTHRNYGNAREINPDDIPEFDMLCGGFPCQSFSIAGKRKGFQDTRGTLFHEILRIAERKRPRLLFLENVKGLLSADDGRCFGTIISSLDELGYDVEWQVLNSKHFGVPQNRERVFIIGHLRGTGGQQVFPLRQAGEAYSPTVTVGEEVCDTASTMKRSDYEKWNGNYLIQMNHIHDSNYELADSSGLARTLKSNCHGRGSTGLYAVRNIDKVKDRGNGRRMKEDNEDMFTLTGQDVHGNAMHIPNPIVHSLQPRSPDRPSLKDNPNTGGSGHLQKEDGSTYCLDSKNGQAGQLAHSIRRLTPIECARLQGFPDDWSSMISDSQAYKCYGNAVTVNVIQAIMEEVNRVW